MNKLYTEEHEWISVEDDIATVGISNYAQEQLGDVVFVELPEVDNETEKGADVCVIESVKAAGDVHSPVSGVIVAINEGLEDSPATINNDAENDGWIYKVKMSDEVELESLMDEAAYQEFITE